MSSTLTGYTINNRIECIWHCVIVSEAIGLLGFARPCRSILKSCCSLQAILDHARPSFPWYTMLSYARPWPVMLGGLFWFIPGHVGQPSSMLCRSELCRTIVMLGGICWFVPGHAGQSLSVVCHSQLYRAIFMLGGICWFIPGHAGQSSSMLRRSELCRSMQAMLGGPCCLMLDQLIIGI
jgi:hypothetical protein